MTSTHTSSTDLLLANLGVDSSVLEASLPAVMAVAAAICWMDPNKFPCIVFSMACLGFVFRDPILEVLTRPISTTMSESITKTTEELLSNEIRFGRILSAGTDAWNRALESQELRKTLTRAIVESAMDEELNSAVHKIITDAIIKAISDDVLLNVMSTVAKNALLDAMKDKEFMRRSIATLVEAILVAVEDPHVKQAFMQIVKEGVSTALQDEEFTEILTSAAKEVLSDGSLYRATASGMVGAMMQKRTPSNKNP